MPAEPSPEPQRVSAAEILEAGAPASDPSRAIDVTRLTGAQAQLIANYKALSDVARAGPMELIDRVVVKALLPIVTLAVGYVLGHESRKQS